MDLTTTQQAGELIIGAGLTGALLTKILDFAFNIIRDKFKDDKPENGDKDPCKELNKQIQANTRSIALIDNNLGQIKTGQDKIIKILQGNGDEIGVRATMLLIADRLDTHVKDDHVHLR